MRLTVTVSPMEHLSIIYITIQTVTGRISDQWLCHNSACGYWLDQSQSWYLLQRPCTVGLWLGNWEQMGISQIDFYKFSIVIVLFSIAVQDQSNPRGRFANWIIEQQQHRVCAQYSVWYKHCQLVINISHLLWPGKKVRSV